MFRAEMGQISRQSGVYFAGTIFTVGAGYFFKVYLARVLGAEALGVYALGMTIVGFVGIFNGLGLPQSAVRFVAAYRASAKWVELRQFLKQATLLLLIANVFFGFLLLKVGPIIAYRFYHSPPLSHYFYCFSAIMLLGALTGFFEKVLGGFKEVGRRTVIISFVGVPINIIATVALMRAGYGLTGYLAAQIVAACAVLLMLLRLVRRLTPKATVSPKLSSHFMTSEVRAFSLSVFGLGLMQFVMAHADKVALGYYRGPRQVGIYSVAAALVAYVPIVLQSVNQIFSATISNLHTRGEHVLLARLFQTLTKWTLGLTLPLALVIILCARPLMHTFGVDFEEAWPILIIGTLGQLVNCGVGSVGYLLMMSGNERSLVKIQGTMTVVMLAANVLLVPVWGIVGAAVAAALTNILSNAWYLHEVRSVMGLHPYNRSYLRLLPGALATVMGVFVIKTALGSAVSDWFVVMTSLVAAYLIFGLVTLYSGLNEDDRVIVRAIWTRLTGTFQRSPVSS